MKKSPILAALVLGLAASIASAPALADTIVNQEGNQNPASNGFTVVPGSASGATWNVQGTWCCAEVDYFLSGAQVAQLNSATNWSLTATFANLSTDTTQTGYGPGSYGSYATVDINDLRFDLDLGSDGAGGQVLFADVFAGTPNYTIAGLGTNPVTLEVLYSNSTDTANIYVDGTEVIANYAGYAYSYPSYVIFGGQDGNFSQVELQTNVSAPTNVVPEPSSILLLASGLAGLAGMARRKLRA